MANWSELPESIIDLFIQKLHNVEDFVRSSVVCKSWRDGAFHRERKPFAPWLMLTTDDNTFGGINSVYRFSLAQGKGKKKLFQFQFPQAQGRRCWGSPHGWVVTLGMDSTMYILNPLTGIQTSLPPKPTFLELYGKALPFQYRGPQLMLYCFITKFAFSSNPATLLTTTVPPSLVVMAIFGGHLFGAFRGLAFTTPGNDAWTLMNAVIKVYENDDIIFFNGQFYVVHDHGILGAFDIGSTASTLPKVTDIASPPDRVEPTDRFYLMEMSGELHMVVRTFSKGVQSKSNDEYYYCTHTLEVYKFDFRTNNWSFVEDLGDHALFVGNNASFAISTTIYAGFKGNCIYFTDDHCTMYTRIYCDMGVFDYETEDVEPFDFAEDIESTSFPLFFMPSL